MMAWNPKSYGRVALVGLLLSGLSGCGYDRYLSQTGEPVAISKPKPQSKRSVGKPVTVSADASPYYEDLSFRYVMVRAGDTLSKIAIRHEVPTKSVIALNRSAPPYIIHVGQQVKVPYFKNHTVRAGESLYAIARVYDVSMEELVHFNFLTAPYTLKSGAGLKIPQRGSGDLRVASTSATTWAVSRPEPVQNREQIVLVRPVAAKSNKDLTATPLPVPTARKVLPTPAPAVVQTPAVEAVSEKPVVLGGTEIAAVNLPPLPRSRYSIKQPPMRAGKIFTWPVKGDVLSGYGKKKNGLHNDGINIKVKPGSPVKAAENGIVSYVGNEMRSFGNLILISHSDGYVTTYGHNAQILVRKGDVVRKGEVIAHAGATGDVQTAQLHFEIRKEGAAVNPAPLMSRN